MTRASDIESWHREAELALARREYRRAHELSIRILQADSANAGALLLLALIAADHANFRKALDVLERALAIDSARPDLHAQRARCLVALNSPREAYEAAARALALGPRDALTFDTIGVAMSHSGAHAESVAPFRKAVELDPRRAAYRYNLGAALQFVGDFDAAAAAYRAALAIDPSLHRAWSALAQVARKPFSPAEVAAIERQLDEPGLDEDRELALCHALAKHHEDHGRYAPSFRCLERGKARKRAAGLRVDYRELFAAARRAAVPAEASAGSAMEGYPSEEPVFVVGMPRTGTTLVERILSSHPAIYSAGELSNLSIALKRAAATPSNVVLDAATLDAGRLVDPRALGEEYVASTRPRTGTTPRFIDKMPLNFFYVGLIRRALPNARVICLRRNALDACLSNYRQLFAAAFTYYGYSYDLLETGRFYVQFDALARHWRETIGASYTEVWYEDVVQHTEREARRLVEFCGLEWDRECLEFERNTEPVATASSVQVREPVYRTAVGRWRRYGREIEPLKKLLEEAGVV